MAEKIWQNYSLAFKELLGLEYSPVAVAIFDQPFLSGIEDRKFRICRAILDAGKGASVQINKKNNACFGAAWHLGFHRLKDKEVAGMVRKFVVEGEKLFSSYQALDKLMSEVEEVADHSSSYFVLTPMEKAEFMPQLVIFTVNAEQACRLLTLVTFLDGAMPKIQIGGPTCRMSIIYPLASNEVNLSFYDHTARKMCQVEKDKLVISIPYVKIPKIIEAIDKCSAGTAKIEFPPEFRQFLQKRMGS
jgi:uncharacterized protein (DUF169 family)